MNIMKLNLFAVLALAVASMMLVSCGDDDLPTSDFDYDFHSAYDGDHPDDLTATMTVTELESGNSMITVELTNTVDGETYPMHAHDKADASTTPNGTPYNESPNAAVFATSVTGNGGTASVSAETTMTYTEITSTYDGFFVVHDPLQAVNTADVTTYVVLGDFAR